MWVTLERLGPDVPLADSARQASFAEWAEGVLSSSPYGTAIRSPNLHLSRRPSLTFNYTVVYAEATAT